MNEPTEQGVGSLPYVYGLSDPERGGPLVEFVSQFFPARREVLKPSGVEWKDDPNIRYVPQTPLRRQEKDVGFNPETGEFVSRGEFIPGIYGEPEYALENMPAVRALQNLQSAYIKHVLSPGQFERAVNLIKGAPSAIGNALIGQWAAIGTPPGTAALTPSGETVYSTLPLPPVGRATEALKGVSKALTHRDAEEMITPDGISFPVPPSPPPTIMQMTKEGDKTPPLPSEKLLAPTPVKAPEEQLDDLIELGINEEFPFIGENLEKWVYLGDRAALNKALADPQYEEYRDVAQSLARSHLGDEFKVYRIEGLYGTEEVEDIVSSTFSKEQKETGERLGREVFEATITPSDVIAFGHTGEAEILVRRDVFSLTPKVQKRGGEPEEQLGLFEEAAQIKPQQLTAGSLFDKKKGRKLLIVGCCETKSKAKELIPASERYKGPLFTTLNKAGVPEDVDVAVLSAKHGLIRFDTPLEDYNVKMKDGRKDLLNSPEQLARINNTVDGYGEVFVAGGKDYRNFLDEAGIKGKYTTYTDHRKPRGIGDQRSILAKWLKREKVEKPKPESKKVEELRPGDRVVIAGKAGVFYFDRFLPNGRIRIRDNEQPNPRFINVQKKDVSSAGYAGGGGVNRLAEIARNMTRYAEGGGVNSLSGTARSMFV